VTTAVAKKRALDFTGVQDRSGVNPKNVPAGDYLARIDSVTEGESNSGNEQWVFVISLVNKKGGGTYPYYCQLDDNLWKIRNLIMATGIAVPKKRIAVDPQKLLKKEIGITLDDDEYEGRMKSVITNVFPAEDVEEEEDEEEVVTSKSRTAKPAARTTRKAATTKGSSRNRKPAVDDDEEAEEVDEDELEALELDEL
jgi:hypothetical protein